MGQVIGEHLAGILKVESDGQTQVAAAWND